MADEVQSGTQPEVAVLLATRDRTHCLPTSINSILAGRYQNLRIVVIDNAPRTTDTFRMVNRRYRDDPRVVYVHEPRPGLAHAHNVGLRYCGDAEIIAITDDDVTVAEDWLVEIVAGFAEDERVACVTGLIEPIERRTEAQRWAESFLGLGKGLSPRAFDLDENSPEDPWFPISAGSMGSGANMAFRRSHLDQVGGFNPILGAGTLARGGDDLAAFVNVVASGSRLAYRPSVVVRHQLHTDVDSLRRQVRSYGVGFGAFVVDTMIRHPRLVSRIPRALVRSSLSSSRPARRPTRRTRRDAPIQLSALELMGRATGPYAYLRSRLATRGI